MTTAYTSLLGLALPVTGELSGTWGDTVNTAITSLLDTAVAGTTSITTDADITLTTTTGASNQARQAIILWNPASGTTTRNITAPAQSKLYTVINASGGTQSIVIRGAGPTTGVTIAKGESAQVAWNGSDFVKVGSSGGAATFTNLTVTGNTILGDAAADTLTVNATSTFASPVNFTGQVKLPSTGRSAAAALTPTNPAFLYGVASTYTDTTSSGTLAPVAPFYGIAQPTLSTSNVTTYTNAATLYIANAPAAGGSATITNPYALYVAAGANYFGGAATFNSTLAVNGNTTLGDATGDTLTVNAGTTTFVQGTANGVPYLNGSKVLTTGSALTFDGTILATTTLDATNIDVTNVRALDGTAAFSIASSTGVVSIDDTKFTLQDETDNTKKAQFQLSGITTATTRTLTVPNVSGTIALLSGTQTFSGATTFSSTFTLSGTTTNISLGASQTTGTWTAGGTAQTGAITLGQSTGAQTLNLGTGATTTATTKTINLGTAGVSGSTTAINIGSAVSGATNSITVNGNPTFNSGTANGVAYLDGSKVLTTGSGLVFDGTNLGIGTSSPAYRLEALVGAGSANIVRFGQSGVSNGYTIVSNGTNLTHTWDVAGSSMVLNTAGNLGLGVTPSAWGSSIRSIDIGPGTALTNANSTTDTWLSSNAYYTTQWLYKNTAPASYYRQASGAHQWFTAPSGTAGNAITFTQAMTLDGNGDFLIGTTSAPANGANARNVVFNNPNSVSTYVKISNAVSGATASDGFDLIMGTSSDAYVYNRENGPMIFGTNNTERARITSGGDYVVGSSSTVGSAGRIQAVQASSTGNACISADAQSSSYAYNIAYLNTNTAAGSGFYFISCTSGNYGTYQFRVRGDGTIYAQDTTVQSLSDVRVKENIRDSEEGLPIILGLKPRRFDFKQGFGNDRKNVLGFIAQEIETVFPDAVDVTPVDPDGDGPEEPYKSVGPGSLIPVLVKAIQELNAKVEAQAAEIAALKSK